MTHPNRRTFLRHALGSGALLAATPRGSLAARRPSLPPPNAGTSQDEAYWGMVKESFPFAPGLVLMNAANLCPSPFVVQDAVFAWTRDIDADASFQNRDKFGALRETSRDAVARHIGAHPDEIALTRNTSEGNNTVAAGVDLGPGDEVLLWDQNHPTNATSWDERAAVAGFEVRRISTPPLPDSPGVLIDAFRSALTARTKVLAFSHVSNATGVRLPAAELCAIARIRGILTLVDGAQSCGALKIDVHEIGCDFYTASSHKWLMGPKEAGVLYVRADTIERLRAADVGVGWSRALEGGARKFESLGQRDDGCVAAIATTIEFHERIGAEVIEARLLEITGALKAGLRERIPSVEFHTPMRDEMSSGVLVFRVPEVDSGSAYQRLYDEHMVAAAGRGGEFEGIRLSPHVYNTLADVEHALDAITAVMA